MWQKQRGEGAEKDLHWFLLMKKQWRHRSAQSGPTGPARSRERGIFIEETKIKGLQSFM